MKQPTSSTHMHKSNLRIKIASSISDRHVRFMCKNVDTYIKLLHACMYIT